MSARSEDGVAQVVRRDADRFDTPLHFLNGRFDLKVSARETGGALCVFDTVRTESGGPPLHIHFDQDEWFFVLEGEFILRVGEVTHRLGPGDSVFGPRGIPHAFANLSERARLVVLFQPAGTMEDFFREGSAKGKMTPQQFADLSAAHRMKVVGPPLPLDSAIG
ncbi:cupin domain-containing protein [Tabrizicola sp. J26]|uniref:cupin domain-containing protein n=1 Tax=Alitabrizicola rongguiensis TaxID=2909234 RepID=UPI001F264DE5|nr:cupin domain-containing protein [Tabrizicola rongguiensis]MCF1710235.1 cupin domain-containing protein [Tabrizicola rongguiensis]